MNDSQNHGKRFGYFYFNRRDPIRIGEAVAAHVSYWQTANPQGYMGGPFADRQGGLISFVASSLEEATQIILQDPFIVEDLIEQTNGVVCRKDKGVLDEIPGAYKDIDEVMANQSDLVEVVHTLKQVLCVKG